MALGRLFQGIPACGFSVVIVSKYSKCPFTILFLMSFSLFEFETYNLIKL